MFVSFDDIISLSVVCQRLSEVIQNSGPLWKHLLWYMYPGTSLLKYAKMRSASGKAYEHIQNAHLVKDNDHLGASMNQNVDCLNATQIKHLKNNKSSCEEFHSPNVAKKLCLQIKNTKNYWKRQFGSRHSIGVLAKEWMDRLSPQYFDVQDLSDSDMEQFLDLTTIGTSWHDEQYVSNTTCNVSDTEILAREFVLDAILSLIHDGKNDCELTLKYYATKVIRYVRNKFARDFWLSYKEEKPPKFQDYYRGLVHFSQWFQPLSRICIASVKFDVDRIAISTVKHLYTKYPKHPLFRSENQPSSSNTCKTKCDTIDPESFHNYLFTESVLSESETIFENNDAFKILDSLNYIMFEEERFRGNTSNYYNPNNSYIDKVLETRQGIPITLCILYMLIAKRLGISLEPINFPRHFLLRLKIKNIDTYIDVFQKGKRLSQQEVRNMDEETTAEYPTATPIEVFQRMVRNMIAIGQMMENVSDSQSYSLLRAALELQKIIGAEFEHPGFGLVQLYLQQNINHREVKEELDNYENWPLNMWIIENNQHLKQQVRNLRKLCMRQLEDNKKQLEENSEMGPKLRSEFCDVHGQRESFPEMGLYSVGMVMKHKRYNYVCVIYGWDAVCKQSKVWIRQMGVDRLRWKEKQPFYNVLVEDGSYRYAASENLFPAKPQRVLENLQVGKYFMEFDEQIGYIANKELTTKYPEDAEVQLKFQGSWRKDRNSSSSNSETNS